MIHRQLKTRGQLQTEQLEARLLLAADVFISEFSASNDTVLRDDERDYPDWIELFNAGDEAADLTGWYLTDDDQNPTKWSFPTGQIEPGEFMIVFASGKNFLDDDGLHHTNFQLSAAGEYLALIQPDATTIATEFSPTFPRQLADISYGVRMGVSEMPLVSADSGIQLLIPQDNRYGVTWRSNDFVVGDDWLTELNGQPLTASIGFETDSGFGASIQSNVGSLMQGVNASAYVRVPFQVNDPSAIKELVLNLKYDDGVGIYLNGGPIEVRNISFFATFNSGAENARDNAEAVAFEQFDLNPYLSSLVPGENVLALHAANVSAADNDFLLAAELVATVESIDVTEFGYFPEPTPNARNGGEFALGPEITDAAHSPASPLVSEPMTITAKVEKTFEDLSTVELGYRVMYGDEVRVTMTDNGQGVDATANDGIFSAQIPGNIANPGEMIRYFITATDVKDNAMRLPRVTDTTGTDQSAEYFGTITQDPTLESSLPIFHWFAESVSRARSRSGTRVSVYYEGEFYDNAFARQRGGATNGSSQKFNFSDDHLFFVNEKIGRVAEFNMNAQGSDPTYVRQPMAFTTYTLADNEASESFFMLMRDNASNDRVGVFIEQVDEIFLERQGLDPDGALYKFVQRSNLDPVFADTTTGIEKKTRLDEGLDDIREVVDGLTKPTQEERGISVFDNFNIAQVLNYLALRSITLDADDVRKNFYLYRDTNGTGQWSIFPWDKDWTFGITGDGGQFLEHPFFADEAHRKDNALQWNRLYDAVFNDPVLSDMYLRRLRTVMDEVLQAPGTQDGILEMLADEIAATADGFIPGNISSIKTYLTNRRDVLFNTHVVDPDDTGIITDIISEFSDAQYFVPTNNDLGQTWTAVDDPTNIADWQTGKTGLGFGNRFVDLVNTEVIPVESCDACSSLYLRMPFDLADASAVSKLTLRMKYDDGFIAYINGEEVARANVLGDVSFDMDSRSHSNVAAVEFENFNISDRVDLLRTGRNVLSIQVVNSSPTNTDLLVVPVLVDGVVSNSAAAGIPLMQVGNPQISFGAVDHNPAGSQDQEYIELRNENSVAVDISGWRVEGGIDHTFPAGTVIPSGRSLYMTPSVPGFKSRTDGPTGGQGLMVQGNYMGHLSNFGEQISLVAKDGTVLDTFTTPVTPSDVQLHLRVSEVFYNPEGTLDTTEFIELVNTSSNVPLDLTGVTFASGPQAPFQIPDGTMLAPGQALVLAQNREALLAAFPSAPSERVLGDFVGRLGNNGERIKIDDANGSTVVEFRYDDEEPWPIAADGTGSSLVQISLSGDEDDPKNWTAATPTPGFTETIDRDLNADGAVNSTDIDFACNAVRQNDLAIDLNQDGIVNREDVTHFVEVWLGTSAGDANLDGVFNSSDLVAVFQAGEFEDSTPGNSTWAEGDWNCDSDFGTRDLVAAFQVGRYIAAAHAVASASAVVSTSAVDHVVPFHTLAGLDVDSENVVASSLGVSASIDQHSGDQTRTKDRSGAFEETLHAIDAKPKSTTLDFSEYVARYGVTDNSSEPVAVDRVFHQDQNDGGWEDSFEF